MERKLCHSGGRLILRVAQIVIVVIWLLSTGLLVRRTYFPESGLQPKVDPRHVATLFFGERGATDMALVADERVYGRFSVNPRAIRSNDFVPEQFERGDREVFFHGILFEVPGLPDAGQIFLNGSLYVDGAFAAKGLRLQVRVPADTLTGQIYALLEPPSLAFELRQAGEVVLDSREPGTTDELMKEMRSMASGMGVELPEMDWAGEIAPLVAMIQPEVQCRHGRFSILEKWYDGYIVQLRIQGEDGLRLYFSELGELLRVDGLPGVSLVGETFIPQDMRDEPEAE